MNIQGGQSLSLAVYVQIPLLNEQDEIPVKISLFLFTFSKYRVYAGILLDSKYVHAYILVKEICLQKIIFEIPTCLMNKNSRSNDFTLFSVLCKSNIGIRIGRQ